MKSDICYPPWREKSLRSWSMHLLTLSAVRKHRRYMIEIYLYFYSFNPRQCITQYVVLNYFWPWLQNVKAVFDQAIRVVLQPPKAKKKKGKGQRACSILWSIRCKHLRAIRSACITLSPFFLFFIPSFALEEVESMWVSVRLTTRTRSPWNIRWSVICSIGIIVNSNCQICVSWFPTFSLTSRFFIYVLIDWNIPVRLTTLFAWGYIYLIILFCISLLGFAGLSWLSRF